MNVEMSIERKLNFFKKFPLAKAQRKNQGVSV